MKLPDRTLGRPAAGCICGKRMLEAMNEGTCLWCGRGSCRAVTEYAYQRNMQDNASRLSAPTTATARLFAMRSLRPRWTEDGCVLAYRRWEATHHRPPRPYDWQQPLSEGDPARPSYGTVRKLFGGWPGFLQYVAEIPREQAA